MKESSIEFDVNVFDILNVLIKKHPSLSKEIQIIIENWKILDENDKKMIFYYYVFKEISKDSIGIHLTRSHRLGTMSDEEFLNNAKKYIEKEE